MRIAEENWKVLASLFPAGWQQMAWRSGAVERLRGFPSADVLLRMLMLHVARGYSLRETVVRAKLANWADISDVALLKRLRNSEHGPCLRLNEVIRFLGYEKRCRRLTCHPKPPQTSTLTLSSRPGKAFRRIHSREHNLLSHNHRETR
jgi:hypothetical protein